MTTLQSISSSITTVVLATTATHYVRWVVSDKE